MDNEARLGRAAIKQESYFNRRVVVQTGGMLGVLYVVALGLSHLSFRKTCNGVISYGQIAEELQSAGVKLGSNDQNLDTYKKLSCRGKDINIDRRTLLAKLFLF